MGIEKDGLIRRPAKNIEEIKAVGPQEGQKESTKPGDTQPIPSRLVGKSLNASREARGPESAINVFVGMKVVQRDDPRVDWEVSRIESDMVLLYDRSRNTYVSKKLNKFVHELSTPGSPWRRRGI